MHTSTFWRRLNKINKTKRFRITRNKLVRQIGSNLCPVCAVAKAVTNTRYDNDEYYSAAEAIDLDINFAEDIVNSADWDDDGKYRKRLVNLCKKQK